MKSDSPTHQANPLLMIAGALAIALAALFAYWPAIQGGFIWDDDSYVTGNRLLQDLDGLGQIWVPFQTPQYYPVVFTSFWIEYQLWELNPRGYHIVNVLLHILNALLIWRLCIALRLPGGVIGGWLVAALFALHPVHVESVAWITERKNVLSGALYLSAALAYLRFETVRCGESQTPPQEAWGWYGLSLVLFVFALLSKSVTCSLPAALILFMLYQRRTLTVGRLLPLAPLFAIGLLLALNTAAIERSHVGAEGAEFDFSVAERLLIASKALVFYPFKLITAWPVMFVYPRWSIDDGNVISYWSVAVIGLIGLAAIWMYRRGWRGLPLALAFYAGTIFPALGFVNIYPMRFSYVADHFAYLASLGIIAGIIGGLQHMAQKQSRLVAIVVAVLALPILVGLTHRQSRTYQNRETVYRDTLGKNNEAWMPHNNLGSWLIDRDPVEAEYHFREALRIKPDHHPARSNLAEALSRQGRVDEALREIQGVIEQLKAKVQAARAIEPQFMAWDYQLLGNLQQRAGQIEAAEASFRKAVTLAPGAREPRLSLASLCMNANRLDDAAAQFEALIKLDPMDWAALRSLALVRQKQQRYADALNLFDRAMNAAPGFAEQTQVGPAYVRLLATCPDEKYRNTDKAISMAQKFVEHTEAQDPAALDMLASVLAEAGQFDRAAQTAQQALEAAQEGGMTDFAEQIRARLDRYRSGERSLPY
jgi:protein O-mannosyl-transferase